MEDTKMMDVGGHEVRVLDAGRGRPVVILHGWGGRIESMTPVLTCLSVSFRVIAVDLPGFGDSPVPGEAWGTPDYAAFVRDLLVALGVDKAHFVGHSFGAKTSLCIAGTYPSLVDRLVVVGSSGLRIPPSASARAKRLVSRGARAAGRAGPAGRFLRDRIYSAIASEDYRQAGDLRPILVKVVNEDFTDLLPRVKAPTLLVWGSRDDAAPLSHGRRMEELIPDAGLVVFEGAGHFAYLDEPQRFCVITRHFLGAPVQK